MSPDADWWEKVRRARDGEPVNEEKPLHVRVAEALPHGRIWKAEHPTEMALDDAAGTFILAAVGEWLEEVGSHRPYWRRVRRYDTDWSATGPLITRFGICLVDLTREEATEDLDGRTVHKGEVKRWAACSWLPIVVDDESTLLIDGYVEDWCEAKEPLEAACLLILDLAAKGAPQFQKPAPGASDGAQPYRATPPEGGWKGMPK